MSKPYYQAATRPDRPQTITISAMKNWLSIISSYDHLEDGMSCAHIPCTTSPSRHLQISIHSYSSHPPVVFFFLPTSDEPKKKKRVKFLVETECFPGVHMLKKQSSGAHSTKAISPRLDTHGIITIPFVTVHVLTRAYNLMLYDPAPKLIRQERNKLSPTFATVRLCFMMCSEG